jgi:CTP:phosphocholine cytidylyltransferase-like protein
MKTLFSFTLSMLLTAAAFAGTVRVTINGNKDFVVKIDGRIYTPNTTGTSKQIVITDLQNGRHRLQILRPVRNGSTREIYSSNFNLNANESLDITVNGNGRVHMEETTDNLAYGDNGYNYPNNPNRSPMTESSFNQLYRYINNQYGQSAKMTSAREVFNNSNNYMSTAQARQIILLMNTEATRLELAKLSYDNIADPENFTELYDVLNRQTSRDELDAYVRNNSGYNNYPNNNYPNNNYPNNNYPNNSYPNSTYRSAMTDAAFNTLYQNIRKNWLPGAKMSAASDAFNQATNYFTTAQARQIIALLSSDANRLELAKLSYDNIVDPANFQQLYDLLSSQASRDELDAWVRSNSGYNNNYPNNSYPNNNYPNSSTYRTAMTDAAFNTLYQNIRKNWLPGAKMSAASDAFNQTTNYFTTAQARQIISLLSSEANRLELAKLSFDNIVDPANFRTLYDLLNSQASRDELDQYIRSNYNYQY